MVFSFDKRSKYTLETKCKFILVINNKQKTTTTDNTTDFFLIKN